MTEQEIAELEARWRQEWASDPRPRILTPLPWHTRLRLEVTHAVNVVGCWLVNHGHPELAMRWWELCGRCGL